jgi:hypothetical protein
MVNAPVRYGTFVLRCEWLENGFEKLSPTPHLTLWYPCTSELWQPRDVLENTGAVKASPLSGGHLPKMGMIGQCRTYPKL